MRRGRDLVLLLHRIGTFPARLCGGGRCLAKSSLGQRDIRRVLRRNPLSPDTPLRHRGNASHPRRLRNRGRSPLSVLGAHGLRRATHDHHRRLRRDRPRRERRRRGPPFPAAMRLSPRSRPAKAWTASKTSTLLSTRSKFATRPARFAPFRQSMRNSRKKSTAAPRRRPRCHHSSARCLEDRAIRAEPRRARANLRQGAPDHVLVLADCCQLRCSTEHISALLGSVAFSCALTGSKFAGGPTFCGALLVPPRSSSACARKQMPSGLAAYSAQLDWPSLAARQACRSPFCLPPIWASPCDGRRRLPRSNAFLLGRRSAQRHHAAVL